MQESGGEKETGCPLPGVDAPSKSEIFEQRGFHRGMPTYGLIRDAGK
jgi:hypothetical protein